MSYSNLDSEKKSIKDFDEWKQSKLKNCYLVEKNKQLSDSTQGI